MVNRVILGNLGSVYGLKVSKPGIDVTTATDSQLLFNTQNNFLRTIITGTISLGAGTTTSTTVNLGATYGSLILAAYLTTPISGRDLVAPPTATGNPDLMYYATLDSSGILTFGRLASSSMAANTLRYTVFGQ